VARYWSGDQVLELKDPATGKFYCMEQARNCLATSKYIPQPYGPAEGLTATDPDLSNIYGNYYTPTSGSPLTFTFAGGHGLGADSRVFVSNPGVIYPVSVVSSTVFSLTGSGASTGEVFLRFERPDAPWLWADDGCTVSGATNASPIKVTCVNEHKMQTGNRICITGVGGNTAANGCWQITWTGNATFTLDGSTGNGAYTSGGTVTPGGEPCASGCTVTIPTLSKRAMFYRRRFLDSSGTLIGVGPIETTITP
jgi:hypothetical protein